MSGHINDGGPAFPTADFTSDNPTDHIDIPCPGMSLRAYIAAQVVAGMYASTAHPEGMWPRRGDGSAVVVMTGCTFAMWASDAVAMADALIARLEKP